MSPGSELDDVEQFERQVLSITDRLESAWTGDATWNARRFGASSGDDRVEEEILNQLYEDVSGQEGSVPVPKEEFRAAAREAAVALGSASIRATLCRILRPVTGQSSRDIAAELIKAGLPLALAGQLALPVSPLVWGLVGFTIAYAGTSWLCGDPG